MVSAASFGLVSSFGLALKRERERDKRLSLSRSSINMKIAPLVTSLVLLLSGCASGSAERLDTKVPVEAPEFVWRGVDLSYVNEIEDCGATYLDANGRRGDPYSILANAGANLVRLRLWVSPTWTEYSTLKDVKRSIARARQHGMEVLLDFHFSDDWAHPGKQLIPADWASAENNQALAQKMYDYTYGVLKELAAENLLPEHVQVGNETNTELFLREEVAEDAPINWTRNVVFLNAGIGAVRQFSADSGRDINIMLHIAQPENVERWLDDGAKAGLKDFDLIGISYYAKWSKMPFSLVGPAVALLSAKYQKPVIIVETAYPWTLDGNDSASNLLGPDSLINGYPATRSGQSRQISDLLSAVLKNGGEGIVYWEPAWISSSCSTRWGKGSHWENAALFDFDGRLHKGAAFLKPVPKVDP
jgi:arabinogalactan endo-1,4-beta-galactosidase